MSARRIDQFSDRVQQPSVLYVDVFPYIRGSTGLEFLALKRRNDVPLPGAWQPVCGKINVGESIEAAFGRQVLDKTGHKPKRLMNLDRVATFYDAYYDAVLMVPAAAAELDGRDVTIDEKLHEEFRWFGLHEVDTLFAFESQIDAVRKIARIELQGGFSPYLALRVL